ncbi:Diaminopimelate epimerase [Lacunisphaera limnophila]|uniref:Diaminopimelate epimerase n=1 Tax=Lacunisphaera limnophila TaxID=1838286 RepID=A0A1D8AZL8_9BACT|nr:diaminopimelate epimerase [Lacunisphaera limnophila]AOS46314.1 Diaminopimelate epimerase [Lacunisphaera limnophila]
MRFHKYHALGNDYIVMDPADFPGWTAPTTEQTRVICHRNFGAGSDGILWGPLPTAKAQFGLRIFNPDGSEAEKSGNGLRIFSRYLYDQKKVGTAPFTVDTPGGVVDVVIQPGGQQLTIDMGHVSFASAKIPVAGPAREVINEKITILDREFRYCAATIGNPHCVIPLPAITPELAHKYGPHLETHPNFPRKTNVQFLQVLDRANIRIEIWERGAGYTLASGSSSSASAAVAHRLGLVDRNITVHMPGGRIGIEIGDNFSIRMTGPVTRVAEGTLHPELFTTKV